MKPVPLNEYRMEGGVRQTIGDISRQLANTYVLAQTTRGYAKGTPPGVCKIRALSDELTTIEVKEVEGGPTSSLNVITRELLLHRVLPDPGVYAIGRGHIGILRRRGTRQWQEGLCVGNSSVFVDGLHFPRDFDLNLAAQLYKEQTNCSLEQALAQVHPGACIRIDQKYWVQGTKEKITNLYRRTGRVGSFVGSQFFWAPDAKIFREELKDELNFHV